MDKFIVFLVIASVLTLTVFISGVLTGYLISQNYIEDLKKEIKKSSCLEVKDQLNYWENILYLYAYNLPYRLESGDFNEEILNKYMEYEYKYYSYYEAKFKECNLEKIPILYFAKVDKKSKQCGELLDKFHDKLRIFTFIDNNSLVYDMLKKKYNIKEIPSLYICGRLVNCDKNEIIDAIISCKQNFK